MDKTTCAPASIACMLDVSDFKDRLAWIADLNREALMSSRRDDLRFELTYTPRALDDVREMVRREHQWCAFLKFELRDEPDAIRLVVTAPEDAREAVELVFELFQAKSAPLPPRHAAASRAASNESRHHNARRPLA